MSALWYIGDEATAAGFRLAGVRVVVPSRGEEGAVLAGVREHASLIMISAAVASRIPAHELARAEVALAPLTLIVPDFREELPPPDLATRVRAQLGLEDAR